MKKIVKQTITIPDSKNIYYQYKLISLFAASIILSCTRKAKMRGIVSNLLKKYPVSYTHLTLPTKRIV